MGYLRMVDIGYRSPTGSGQMTVETEGSFESSSSELKHVDDAIELIREVPGMYVGDVGDGSGLHYLVEAAVTLALNEHLAGQCTWVDVALRGDGEVEVRSDGPEIVDDEGPYQPCPRLDRFTSHRAAPCDVRAAARFQYGHYAPSEVSINAVSEHLTAVFPHRGRRWHLGFERGRLTTSRSTEVTDGSVETVIAFKPDPLLFSNPVLSSDRVEDLLRQMSFMLPGLALTFRDESSRRAPRTFCSTGGVADLLRHLDLPGRPLFDDPIVLSAECEAPGAHAMRVDLALRWRRARDTIVVSSVNGWRSYDDGTHVDGLRDALPGCLMAYAIEAGLLPRPGDRAPGLRVACADLTAVVSLWHARPVMGLATRTRLESPEARPFVAATVDRQLYAWLRAHPDEARSIVSHLLSRVAS